MFATIYTLRPKPGQEQAILELWRKWKGEGQPSQAVGVLEELLVQSVSHIGELLGITIFDSEASFKKNVLSSEHENWHQQVRDFLEKEPEWNDGVILLSTLASPGPTRI